MYIFLKRVNSLACPSTSTTNTVLVYSYEGLNLTYLHIPGRIQIYLKIYSQNGLYLINRVLNWWIDQLSNYNIIYSVRINKEDMVRWYREYRVYWNCVCFENAFLRINLMNYSSHYTVQWTITHTHVSRKLSYVPVVFDNSSIYRRHKMLYFSVY